MLKQNARYKARVDVPRASSSNYNTHTVISGINKDRIKLTNEFPQSNTTLFQDNLVLIIN